MAKKLVQGNEAIAQAALDAGLGFFAGYPITPASEIMHYLADKNILFMQPEDEIASINLCLGASLAGEKSMTATSGPGFSLMQEAIGFGHVTRIPMVIVNSQRVGPATGMPTMPSQGDLLQAKHGSHGDYTSIVFYPNSVAELYEYTIQAFNASEQSKIPIILLSDAMLSHMYETVDLQDIAKKIKLVAKNKEPLGKGKMHITGLLSRENVPVTKDSKYYIEWFAKYKKDIGDASKNYEFFEYIKNEKADSLIVSFGITSRVVLPLKEKYSLFRPIRIFPLLEKQIKGISEKYKQVIVIEMNDGQYASELKKILGEKVKSISVLGGKITLDIIKKELKKIRLFEE